MRGDVVHALDDGRDGSNAVVGENFDADNVRRFGETVDATSSDGGAKGAVRIAVRAPVVAVGKGGSANARGEFFMVAIDASVENVEIDAFSPRRIMFKVPSSFASCGAALSP